MGLFKKVLKQVRFEPEVVFEIEAYVSRYGKQDNFSNFVRNAVDKDLKLVRQADDLRLP